MYYVISKLKSYKLWGVIKNILLIIIYTIYTQIIFQKTKHLSMCLDIMNIIISANNYILFKGLTKVT